MDGLGAIFTGRVEQGFPLAPLTTFRVGGSADWYFEAAREDEIGPLLKFLHERQTPVLVLGEGSNVLIRDGGVRGAVIRLGRALATLEWDGDLARCGAALSSRSLAKRAMENARSGFEWAAALPGNLGGALRGNAGAFGGDMAACFVEFEGWHLDGQPLRMQACDIEFDYRQSSIPADALIGRLALRLPIAAESEREALREKYEEVLAKRAASQPGGLFTAGSTFKNPPGDYAGRLIETCGLKGRAVGGARVSERHANFIEATGDSVSAADIEGLMDLLSAEVEKQTGIHLEREVKVYGQV
jgi:UDP-N-acetylmuramate dehydrogenase